MRQVGFIGNSGLPGNKRYPEVITDPNKQTETITCPVRELDLEIPLNDAVDFNHFKIEFNMEGALFGWYMLWISQRNHHSGRVLTPGLMIQKSPVVSMFCHPKSTQARG